MYFINILFVVLLAELIYFLLLFFKHGFILKSQKICLNENAKHCATFYIQICYTLFKLISHIQNKAKTTFKIRRNQQ